MYALLPAFYDDDSRVGIEAHFSTTLPNGHTAKEEWLASWISYSYNEEVEEVDSAGTSTWVNETMHVGLACAMNYA